MRRKRILLGICSFLGMLVLILDGKTAVVGAFEGIELCIRTVIPSLFPFFIFSNIITSTYMGVRIPFLGKIGKVCGIPAGMESILVPAFLGGYPVGTQTVVQQYKQGQIPKKEAQRLLGFCNNAGPSFIFGMAASLFSTPYAGWILWVTQLLSALMTAKLLGVKQTYSGHIEIRKIVLQDVIQNGTKAMASVCAWVVLFRILIAFLDRWFLWILPEYGQAAMIGMLELSNGCMALFHLQNAEARFVICSGILTFGGLCVWMQIFSVAEGLSMRYFLLGKSIQTMLSLLLASCFVYGKSMIWIFPIFVFLLFPKKRRKNGSIPVGSGV